MATQVRYFVRFLMSSGIYRAGDEAALSEADYARELKHKSGPAVELVHEQHEEVGPDGRVILESIKTVVPVKAPPAPDVSAENAALKKRLAQLEAEKANDKASAAAVAENEKLKGRVAELEAELAEKPTKKR